MGRGGLATVYLAQDLKHVRPVALKVLHPERGWPSGGKCVGQRSALRVFFHAKVGIDDSQSR